MSNLELQRLFSYSCQQVESRLNEPQSIHILDHILTPSLFTLWIWLQILKSKLTFILSVETKVAWNTLYPSHPSLFLPLGGLLSGESIYRTRGAEEWHSTHRSPTQPCSAPDGKSCNDWRSVWQDGGRGLMGSLHHSQGPVSTSQTLSFSQHRLC